jgi:hypothetical protein
MAKRPGTAKSHDFTAVARRVVEQAIGEHLDGSPLPDPNDGKNPRRVAAGVEAGKRGGPARAVNLAPAERRAIAVKAANARWGKPTLKKGRLG